MCQRNFPGKNQQQIARDLLPIMDGVRASAKRVAQVNGLIAAASRDISQVTTFGFSS